MSSLAPITPKEVFMPALEMHSRNSHDAEELSPQTNAASANPLSPQERARGIMPRHYSRTELLWTRMLFSHNLNDRVVYLSLIASPSPSLTFSSDPTYSKMLEIELLKPFSWDQERFSTDFFTEKFVVVFSRLLNESGISNIHTGEKIYLSSSEHSLSIQRSSTYSPSLNTLDPNTDSWPNIASALETLGSYIKQAQGSSQKGLLVSVKLIKISPKARLHPLTIDVGAATASEGFATSPTSRAPSC
jgi:hypothetical protein